MTTASPSREPAPLRGTLRQIGHGLLFAAVLNCFANALMLIVPLFTMQVYDRVMTSHSTDTLVMLLIVAVAGLMLAGVLEYIRGRTFQILGGIVARRLNVPALQAAVVDALGGGKGTSQTIRDLNELRTFLTGSAIAVPLELIWVPLFLAVLFLLHPAYGAVACCAAVLLIVLSVITDLATRRPLAEANEAAARTFAEVGATVRHAEAIEAMGMLPAVSRRWQESQAHMSDLLDRGSSRARALAAVTRSLRLILQIGTMAIGVLLVLDNAASPGSMMASGMLMSRLLHPFEQLIDGWRQWVFALSAYGRVRTMLTNSASRRETIPMPRPEGRLSIDRLGYIPPGADRPVLRNVSFALEPGEVLGVIGPSGAGKSTLARLLVGVWEPTAGGIFLDGHSTWLWERESFGKHVGYVPQSVALLEGSVRENIARMQEGDPAAVVAAAKLAGIHEMIGRLPYGYDTPLGDTTGGLSGGQRQRVALARALYGNPRLLVLDEPNSNLDNLGEEALMQAIARAKADGTTVVMITHRPSIVSAVDKLLVLKDGMVEQFGPRAEVMRTVTPAAPKPAVRLVRAGEQP
ncbi:type I secretion system permease/ATPase [Azospirillum sp. TSO22-1]|uniref:type I secretion system permease/ATPase n=1 Tax=Azospirillum sp. TSO22-1 TaxID=716789 RepID=UPI000D6046DD|nr:type I secretion system permease/ATPase [Azospirillum sp. TSO22-1]PWC44891.1 ABC transporter ATP-binding protein [Azospirillum sp. TSO22-1]